MCELACVNSYHWRLDTTRLMSRVVGEPIAESRVVGEPLKQVGKYLYKYQGTPNNVTGGRHNKRVVVTAAEDGGHPHAGRAGGG